MSHSFHVVFQTWRKAVQHCLQTPTRLLGLNQNTLTRDTLSKAAWLRIGILIVESPRHLGLQGIVRTFLI